MLNAEEIVSVRLRNEVDGQAVVAVAARTTDAVQVRFGCLQSGIMR
jgi:hypothetical protein